MSENLNYAAEKRKCYNDSTAYCDKYGGLYDGETNLATARISSALPLCRTVAVAMKVSGGVKD